MHILLPPSETKRSGGGSIFAFELLAHDAVLRSTRMRVRDALVALCSDEDTAAKVLKLGVKNRNELQHNLRLGGSWAMPAIERYTGVLYDALDALSLHGESREWIDAHVSVQSALFGLVAASDAIPEYRASGSTKLEDLGSSLKNVWQEAHKPLSWSAFGMVLDMRSKEYVALAPLPEGAGLWLYVVQRTPGGEMRALNHFNKVAKGDLVRRLALSRATITDKQGLIEWAAHNGLEISAGPREHEVTLVTELGAPTSAALRGAPRSSAATR